MIYEDSDLDKQESEACGWCLIIAGVVSAAVLIGSIYLIIYILLW